VAQPFAQYLSDGLAGAAGEGAQFAVSFLLKLATG
jgi:hypothetical protein